MNITVNGNQQNCPSDTNIYQLLTILSMQDKRIAIEINKEVIPKGAFGSHMLNDGDIVELIQAIGGG